MRISVLCPPISLDEPLNLYRSRERAVPPQVRIANADKTYDQAFTTEYG